MYVCKYVCMSVCKYIYKYASMHICLTNQAHAHRDGSNTRIGVGSPSMEPIVQSGGVVLTYPYPSPTYPNASTVITFTCLPASMVACSVV